MSTTAIQAIRCPTHGTPMEQRPREHQTKEQLWCGVWWDCPRQGCGCAVLFNSAELRASYREMGHTCADGDEGCKGCADFRASIPSRPRRRRRRSAA